jgi:hypothetical protein
MKIIVEKSTNIAKYAFDDSVVLDVQENRIVTPKFIIGDLGANDVIVVNNVNLPNDWAASKYIYSGGNWTINQKWEKPKLPERKKPN